MKTLTIVLAVSIISAIGLTNCGSFSNKQDSKNEVGDLETAKQRLASEMEAYKEKMADKISANQKSIEEFKARIALEKKEAKEEYNEKISGLEQKNSDLKKKLDEFTADRKGQWESFKAEFDSDMDALGKAFKDLTTDNIK